MRCDAAMLGREAKRQRHIEFSKRPHLPIKPGKRIWTKTVGPGETGADVSHTQPPEPRNGIVKTVVLEMKPLADAKRGCVARKAFSGEFRRSVFAKQPHGKMTIV